MTEPLIQKPERVLSQPFAEMAQAIEHNAGQAFGGAAVIVPPANSGETVSVLMLDSRGDAAQFWSTIQTRIQVILRDLEERQRVAGNFGMR